MIKYENIYIISGPSGVGKDSVIKKLSEKFHNINTITTVTTRKIRENEKNNVDYIFVSEKQFETLISENKLIEWSEVYGNFYGVPKNQIEESLQKDIKVIIKTDIQGVEKLKTKLKNAVTIFIMPPNIDILLKRLKSRKTDSSLEIKKRTNKAQEEMNEHKKFDYTIINHEGELESTLSSLAKILEL
tara:strand:+ start:2375 stop:2935 length:561 start_codon:yes stop_codon:yes gene_type:complete